jgi:hypothetical protein
MGMASARRHREHRLAGSTDPSGSYSLRTVDGRTKRLGISSRLTISCSPKLVAGRPKDFEYAAVAISNELVDIEQLRRGLELMQNADCEIAARNLELVIARLP